MKIVEPTFTDIFTVARDMRQADLKEFLGVNTAETRLDLASILATRLCDRGDVMVGHDKEGAVCVGGTFEGRPNVITLLFFANERFPGIALPITRFIKRNLFPRLTARGIHRIEAVSLADRGDVHTWLNTLGLKAETGPLLGFGKNGEAYIQFSWSADHVR